MADNSSAKSLADPVLLETIDKLFQHNIGEYVSLPQLLVVGDQSRHVKQQVAGIQSAANDPYSGKSSVLEGLTDLPFPRDSGLCTRFATHITFRRTPVTTVSVSILPTANAHPDHATKLKEYKKSLEALDQQVFADILREVQKLMGLKEAGVTDQAADTFSDDVLKIEICGPKQQHLSVIDVPGIFRNTTEGMTTDSDIEIVRNMVNQYMRNPRSIILAVIPANVDIATQEILKMAEKCDKKGARTLGVLTKPDLVDKGAENRIVDLVEGRGYKLKLGWLMVKNPGQSELEDPTFDRHTSEKAFFKTKEPWTRLQKDRVGVGSLQGQLRDILTEMVKKEFPNVKSDINKRLSERKKQLESLGPCRENREQQHQFLLDLATRFQSITLHALAARYGDDSVFDKNPALKLATVVVNRSTVFADNVWKLGHTMAFSQGSEEATNDDEEAEDLDEDDDDLNKLAKEIGFDPLSNESNKDNDAETPDEQSYPVRHTETEPDLDDILHNDCTVPMPKTIGIIRWLAEVYKSSRGFELGTFDASLLPVIWRKQSTKWDDLALGYTSDIVSLVHKFISTLISAICEDQRVQSTLMSVLMDGLIDRYTWSINQAKFVVSVERNGTPLTMNHYFADNLEKCRKQRLQKMMEDMKFDAGQYGEVVKLSAILQTSTASNADHTIRDLHDILKSYYKVTRKRFVDVVCMQAVDHYLITGPAAPVKLFSPSFVSKLSDDQLDRIAGEDVSTRKKREELRREIENLTNGKKILV